MSFRYEIKIIRIEFSHVFEIFHVTLIIESMEYYHEHTQ